MSILSQAFSVIIDRGISAPGHVIEVVDGLNTIDKSFLLKLMSTVHLLVENIYYTQMVMHTGTHKYDVSSPDNFKNTCLLRHANME